MFYAERSKYPCHPGMKFQLEVKGTCSSKKSHPGVNFTSPTFNMPLIVSGG